MDLLCCRCSLVIFYASAQITTRILCRTDNALTTLIYSSIGGLLFSSAAVLIVWVPYSPTVAVTDVAGISRGRRPNLTKYLNRPAFTDLTAPL